MVGENIGEHSPPPAPLPLDGITIGTIAAPNWARITPASAFSPSCSCRFRPAGTGETRA